jgi:hypothetical protein
VHIRPIAVRPFVGSEALAAGVLTRHRLTSQYTAVFRDVYIPDGSPLSAVDKAAAAWLWSRRSATLAGLSAAALHGAKWIDGDEPAELVHTSRHQTRGIVLHSDVLCADEICRRAGMPVTTPPRTAFDLGRRGDRTQAVIRVDALMAATGVTAAQVQALADRHRGARGLVQLRRVLTLVDAGAESPQETRLRLVLVDAGLPRPVTQFEVWDGRYFIARLDMAWPQWRIGVEYDGAQHWTDPRQRARDIDRIAELEALGWRIVRVSADMLRYRQPIVVARVQAAIDGRRV